VHPCATTSYLRSRSPLIGANVGKITLYAVRDVRGDYLSSDLVRSNALHGIATGGGLDYTLWDNEGCIAGPFFRYTERLWHRMEELRDGSANACPVVVPRPLGLSFRPIDIPMFMLALWVLYINHLIYYLV
jgi:hypothetical protein